MVDEDLFERVQQARAANRTGVATVAKTMYVYSLSGLAVCGYYGGHLNFHANRRGQARLLLPAPPGEDRRCPQREQFLEPIEAQIATYLGMCHLPDDTVNDIIRRYEQAQAGRDDGERHRREITSRLERISELYKWGTSRKTPTRASAINSKVNWPTRGMQPR